MKRLNLTGTLVIAVALAGASAARASTLFEAEVVGSPVPNQTIAGIAAGGAPWVSEGEARVRDDGRLTVEVSGLLIVGTGTPADGTVGPVLEVNASLVCQKSSVGDPPTSEVVASSGACR